MAIAPTEGTAPIGFAARPRRHKPTSPTAKETVVLAWFFAGWMGGHRMVLGNFGIAAAYGLLTLFSCGLGSLVGYIDGFVLLLGSPRDKHGLPVVWSWRRGKLEVDPLEEGTYEPPESIARILFNVGLLFALPFLVLTAGLMLFETSEVRASGRSLFVIAGLVIVPLFLIQVVGTWRRAGAQVALLRAAGALTRRTRLDAIARAAGIVTPRGLLILFTGLGFLVLSLSYKWASLGVIAVFALSAFYLAASMTSLLSGFFVRSFASNVLQRGAAIDRRFSPGVVRAGDLAEDTLDVKGVPVPPGFFLTVHGTLPPRLASEIRHVIPAKPRDERLSLSVVLKRTPRGTYDAPALRVSFTDLLGLTRAPVASLATARLRVLPSVRPAEVINPPPSRTEEPDLLSRPHRFPTEDLFRFREYVAGDDTRRIQWRMSMRAGRMIVKTPDSRESSSKRVCVVLDTWVPRDWLDHTAILDDALDSLVEAWLAIGQRLALQGEKVTLVLVARAEDGTLRQESVAVSSSNHAHSLDAGARAEWQTKFPIEVVLDGAAREASDARGATAAGGSTPFDNAIVITMRLAAPVLPQVARETTWVFYDPDDALGTPPRKVLDTWMDFDETGRSFELRELARRAIFLPYPVGADENGFFARMKALERRLEDRAHRLALRRLAIEIGRRALAGLLASPDAVYRLEVHDGHLRLVGLKGGAGAAPVDYETRGPGRAAQHMRFS